MTPRRRPSRSPQSRPWRARRGVSALWTLAAMPALIGFCSLAVDYGHCQLVKVELQTAADAAARYACTGIASGVTTAQNLAVDAANDNTADGTPVVLDPATDVEFGTWDSTTKTFTPLTGVARSNASAMRITARRTAATGNAVQLGFAKLIGKPTADVKAVAIATISQGGSGGYGVFGAIGVVMSGSPLIDSYNSAAGPYSAASAHDNGTVVSNFWVALSGNATIKGDVHAGKFGGLTTGGSSTITGNTTRQTSDATFAMPALPSSYTDLGDVSLSGNKTLTLSAGNYRVGDFNVGGNATVNVTGQVTLYVGGNVSIGGSANVNVLNNLPKNFRIRGISPGTITVGGNADLYADIYAPGSAFVMSGSGDLYGAVISGGIAMSGNGGIHYDESLGYGQSGSGSGAASGNGAGGGGASGQISLVR